MEKSEVVKIGEAKNFSMILDAEKSKKVIHDYLQTFSVVLRAVEKVR